jgi:hypothetical protein
MNGLAARCESSANRILALVEAARLPDALSWPRIVSMAYYPTVTMILWAFVTIYLRLTSNFLADAPGLFIGAVLPVGHPVSRPARCVADVFRGDVLHAISAIFSWSPLRAGN